MHLRGISCAAALVLLLMPAARAQSPWYVSGSLGGYFRENWIGVVGIEKGATIDQGITSTSYDPGLSASLALGYKLPHGFRVEVEGGYIDYQTSRVSIDRSSFANLNGQTFNRTSGGDNERWLGTINLFYDLPVSGGLVPYIGGGLGIAQANSVVTHYVDASGTLFTGTVRLADKAVGFLEAGLNIGVGGGFTVVPAYRYLQFFGSSSSRGNEAAHIVKLGLRYSF
jgi:opacity protein-like surface antigen